MYFIDSNIFLEVELKDARYEECKKFLKFVIDRNEKAMISDFILYSILIELTEKSTIEKAKDFFVFLDTVENIEVFIPDKKTLFDAFEKMIKNKLDFDDALVVSCMTSNRIKKLVSFDKHFDKIKEIERIEPNQI